MGYLLIAVNARYLFHTELYETGDAGANSLSVLRAERMQELYGAYSRWLFHHPGPAMFYMQSWGEQIFYRWLHLTPAPYNAQVLVVMGLLVSFFAAGISVAARWVRGGTFVALALAAAALHFTAVDGRFLLVSTWSAHVMTLIMFCLLVSAASVGAGQGEDLPLMVLAGCFLLHLQVAQPLFVGPMFLLGYAGLCWSCRRRQTAPAVPGTVSLAKEGVAAVSPAPLVVASVAPWRVYRRSHRFAVLIAVCFALPILVDMLFPHNNFQQILAHLRTHQGERHSWPDSIGYLLRFAVYKPSLPGANDRLVGAATPHSLLVFILQHPLMALLWLSALLAPLLPLAARLWRGKEPVLLGDAPTASMSTAKYAAPVGRWRFLGWLWATWALSIGLTLFWGTIQDGDLFYFNAWFNYSIWFVLALFAAGAVADALDVVTFRSERGVLWKTVVILLCAVTAGATLARHPERFRADAASGDANRLQQRSITDRLATEPAGTPRAKLLFFPHEGWESATGAAVQLTRTGRPAYVTPDWEFMFGADHQVPDWTTVVSKPADTNPTFEIWHFVPKKHVSGEDARFPLFMDNTLVPSGLPIDPAAVPAIVWQGEGANFLDYVGSGWEGTDGETIVSLATLQFRPVPVPPTANVRITFDFTVLPFVSRHGPQRIEIRGNGNDLGTLTFAPDAAVAQSVTVSAATWNRYGAVLLTLSFPDAVAPALVGGSSDRRPHAFQAHKITFALETAEAPASSPAAVPPVPMPSASAPTLEPTPAVPPAAEPDFAKPDPPGEAPSFTPEVVAPLDQMPTNEPTATPPTASSTDLGNGPSGRDSRLHLD